MSIYWKDDKLLFGPSDKIAFSSDCCCSFLCKQLKDCFHVIGTSSFDTFTVTIAGITNQACPTCNNFNRGYISTSSNYSELIDRCIISKTLPSITASYQACTLNYQINYFITLFPALLAADILVEIRTSSTVLWQWGLTGATGYAALKNLCDGLPVSLPLITNNSGACNVASSTCTIQK